MYEIRRPITSTGPDRWQIALTVASFSHIDQSAFTR